MSQSKRASAHHDPLQETMAVLSDPAVLEDIRDAELSEHYTVAEVRAAMRGHAAGQV